MGPTLATLSAAASAFAIAWLLGLFGEIVPSPKVTAWALREWSLDLYYRLAPNSPRDKFTVAICNLEGDGADLSHTRAVGQVFKGQPGIEVRQIRKVLRTQNWDRSSEIGAYKKGRYWLRHRRADLLIWGEVISSGKAVSLGFVTDSDIVGFRDGSQFRLEGEQLDARFGDVASAQLTAMALSTLKPIYDLDERPLAGTLRPVLARLDSLIIEYPDLTSRQRRDLTIAKGEALRVIADEAGDPALREEAIKIFSASLPEIGRATEPALWSKAQANLGSALARRGEANLARTDLDKAIAAFQLALDERTETERPLLWANTQNNVGNAFYIRARLSDPSLLDEAIKAYRNALRVRTREQFPVHWAFINNHCANAVLHLGESARNADRIKEAIDMYEQAFATADRESKGWLAAMIDNNLGAAFVALDNVEPRQINLDKAITHFSRASREWSRQEHPLRWAGLQINIGEAYKRLGERGEGPEQFLNAADAYRLALEEAAPARAKEIWAKAQRGLANTLVVIALTELPVGRVLRPKSNGGPMLNPNWLSAEQELRVRLLQQQGMERLEEAVKLFDSCLEELTREHDADLWAGIQHDLANACVLLGEQGEGAELFKKALAAVAFAIGQWPKDKSPSFWALARSTEGRALMRLADREQDSGKLLDAISAFEGALAVREGEGNVIECAHLRNNIGAALLYLPDPEAVGALDRAIENFKAALSTFRSNGNPAWIAAAEGNLNTALVRKESGRTNAIPQ